MAVKLVPFFPGDEGWLHQRAFGVGTVWTAEESQRTFPVSSPPSCPNDSSCTNFTHTANPSDCNGEYVQETPLRVSIYDLKSVKVQCDVKTVAGLPSRPHFEFEGLDAETFAA